MDKCEIIKRLKNIAEHAVCTVGEEPFVMSLDDGIAVHEAVELLKKPEQDTTTHDSNVVKTGGNDGDGTSGDCISRQQAIDTIEKHLKLTTIPDYYPGIFEAVRGWLNGLPSIQPEDWMERNKERILRAGMEGREIEFRIGGRLFAIREKAQ